MKKEDVLECMEYIDAEFINEADIYKAEKEMQILSSEVSKMDKRKNTLKIVKYTSMVACLVAVVFAGFILLNRKTDSNSGSQGNLIAESSSQENVSVGNSAQGDYSPMIMVDGIVYKDTYSVVSEEIDENSIQYSTSYTDGEPIKDGEINFDKSGNVPYVVLEDGMVIVQVDGEWRIFKKLVK